VNLNYACTETHCGVLHGAVCSELFDVPPLEKTVRIYIIHNARSVASVHAISGAHKRITMHRPNIEVNRLHDTSKSKRFNDTCICAHLTEQHQNVSSQLCGGCKCPLVLSVSLCLRAYPQIQTFALVYP
jgi:hypothetical protein